MPDNDLRIETATRGDVTYVRVAGTVGDDFEPAALMESGRARELVLHVKELTRFSADGARRWREAIEQLCDRLDRVVLVECSRVVVTELNVAKKLAANLRVASAQVRHVCKRCNSVVRVTYDLTQLQSLSKRGVPAACERCGVSMAADENLELYFGFRQRQQLEPRDEEIAASFPRNLKPAPTRPAAQAVEATSRGKGRWIAAAGLLVFVGVAVAVALSPSSDDAIAAIEAHLGAGRLEDAERLLAELEASGDAEPAALAAARDAVRAARRAPRERLKGEVLVLFRDGRYAEIIDTAEAIGPLQSADTEIAFSVAESLRLTGRLTDAAPYYRIVIGSPEPGPFLDDALFWLAESLLASGEDAEAAELFARVVELPRSRFVRSARRRLSAIKHGQ